MTSERRRLVMQDARQALAVRYPWPGWGADEYAQRSLFDGEGEPAYDEEPTPSREAMRRRLLTEEITKWRRISWRHSHVWNHPKGTELHREYYPQVPDGQWAAADNPHPVCEHDPDILSPTPMSSMATWWHAVFPNERDKQIWVEPTPGVRLLSIVFFENATTPDVSAVMDWGGHPERDDAIVRLHRVCSRILCYKDVVWNGTAFEFDVMLPFAVLRRAAAEENRVTADLRWEPFGWASELDFSVGYQLDQHLSHCPPPPPHERRAGDPVVDSHSEVFDVKWLSHLSLAALSSGFTYISPSAYKLWRHEQVRQGRALDLIVEADFYRYKYWRYDKDAPGSGMDKMILVESGFAGIYGKCHVLF